MHQPVHSNGLQVGKPSTLINASKSTNFIFEITGNINDNVMNKFNELSSEKIKNGLKFLESEGCDTTYYSMENEIFESNLKLIDGDLPKICAYMLMKYYGEGVKIISKSIEVLEKDNPLKYDLTNGHPFYSYKFKKFLSDSALGMIPSKVWNGTADATGGYIIVREDGEVLCYHLFNRNEFETYLIKNTKFETPSRTRHCFGSIYKEEDRYYIKLNLQVRFIK